MADWDLDNPLLAENLQKLLREIRDKALRREQRWEWFGASRR